MRIQNNLMAMNTQRNLTLGMNAGAKSMGKLSSGFRINSAADDAAGLSISEKMRSQIRGLNQASRNTQDGISMIQTAESALAEAQSILQRVRELAVQSGNDTNSNVDREGIQGEINQMTSEINRIGNTTAFNTKMLLRGGTITDPAQVAFTAANGISNVGITADSSLDGVYSIVIEAGNVKTVNEAGGAASDVTVATNSVLTDGVHNIVTTFEKNIAFTAGSTGVTGVAYTGTDNAAIQDGYTITVTQTAGGAAIGAVDTSAGTAVLAVPPITFISDPDGITIGQAGDYRARIYSTASNGMFVLEKNNAGSWDQVQSEQGNFSSPFTHNVMVGNLLLSVEPPVSGAFGIGDSIEFTLTANQFDIEILDAGSTQVALTQNVIAGTVGPISAGDFSLSIGTLHTASDTGFDLSGGWTAALDGGASHLYDGGDTVNFGSGVTAQIAESIGTTTFTTAISTKATLQKGGVDVNGASDIFITANQTGIAIGSDITIDTGATITVGSVAITATAAVGSEDFSVDLKIGANQGESINLTIDDMRAKALGISGTGNAGTGGATFALIGALSDTAGTEYALDVSDGKKALAAIGVIDQAIGAISKNRAKLGAMQNRLEYTIRNLDTSAENTQSAESRIRDIDMAQEMMEYTKSNILQQAATAMLTQANQAPQAILQLLKS